MGGWTFSVKRCCLDIMLMSVTHRSTPTPTSPNPPHPPPCNQYLAVLLLLRALFRSRVRPLAETPPSDALVTLLRSFSLLGVFYFAKTFCYLMLQVSSEHHVWRLGVGNVCMGLFGQPH